MNQVVVLLLLVACVGGVAAKSAAADTAPRAISAFDNNVEKKPKAPAGCGDNKDKHDCLHVGAQEGDCAWCEGDYMPATCLSTFAAKYIPEMVAKCKLPKTDEEVQQIEASDDNKKPKAPAGCGDNKDKHDCLHVGAQEGDCAWCEGDYMSATCVSAMAAKFIPEMVAKCKLPKTDKETEPTDGTFLEQLETAFGSSSGGSSDDWPSGGGDWPSGGGDSGAGGDCKDKTSKKKCLRDASCAWCKQSLMGEGCTDAMSVKYLPKFIADCKLADKDDLKAVEMS